MAVDIKKMVDAICSLTVLELSKLIKALRDKFGLSPSESNKVEDPEIDQVNGRAVENLNESDKPVPDSTPVEPRDTPSDEPIVDIKDEDGGEVPEGSTEPTEEPNESENDGIEVAQEDEVGEETTEAEQGFNPDLNDYDSNWAPAPQKPTYKPNPPPKPEGKDYYLVYAWKWSNDERYAKVGRSSKNGFKSRLVTTYHPTDDPDVIGYRKCMSLEHAEDLQNHILDELKRTRRDREWVEIDEAFEEMINLSFTKGYPE